MRTLATIITSAVLAINSLGQEEIIPSLSDEIIDEESIYTEVIGNFQNIENKGKIKNKITIENTVNFITLYDSEIEDKELLKNLPFTQAITCGLARRIEKDEMKLRQDLYNEDYPLNRFPFEAQLGDTLWDWAVANNFLGARNANDYIETIQEMTTVSYTTEKGVKYKARYQFDEFNKDHPGRLRLTAKNVKYIDNLTTKIGIEDFELSTTRKTPQFGDRSKLTFQFGYYAETKNGEKSKGDIRFYIAFETPSLFFWEDPKDQEKYCKIK